MYVIFAYEDASKPAKKIKSTSKKKALHFIDITKKNKSTPTVLHRQLDKSGGWILIWPKQIHSASVRPNASCILPSSRKKCGKIEKPTCLWLYTLN